MTRALITRDNHGMRCLTIALTVCCALPAMAEEACRLAPIGTAEVASVRDGRTLVAPADPATDDAAAPAAGTGSGDGTDPRRADDPASDAG